MTEPNRTETADAPNAQADAIWNDMVARWQAGESISIEHYRDRPGWPAEDPSRVLDLIYGEFVLHERAGLNPDPQNYIDRFPEYREELSQQFGLHRGFEAAHSNTLTRSDSTLTNPINSAGSVSGQMFAQV